MVSDGRDIFVIYGGVTIAKRGKPGTAYARQWVSLEPGYEVIDNADLTEIHIKHEGVLVH